MKVSNRVEGLQNSPIRKLVPYADKAKEKGLKVIAFNIGQPDLPTPHDFFDAVKSFDDTVLGYANSRGLKRTLETIQLYLYNYGLNFDLDDLAITNGASEALIFSMMTCLDYGDEIITVEPYYTNYTSFARMVGANLISIPTKIEDNFKIPPIEVWEEKITDRTKAILICSPSNPTGRVYTKEELDIIVNLALKYDLYIIADEVYREFNYTDRTFISFADYDECRKNVILLDSMSKKYSSCGARIGSIASKNKKVMDNILKLCQARLAVSTLDQIGAGAMDVVDDEYVYENRRIYKRRRDILGKRLANIDNISASNPEGAFYTMVKLPVDDAEKFAIWTVENIEIDSYTILLTPAEAFYKTEGKGKDEVRISYCIDENLINKGMDVLEKALNEYKK